MNERSLVVDMERFEFTASVGDDLDVTVWLTDTTDGAHYPFDGIAGAIIASANFESGIYSTDPEGWEYAQGHHSWTESDL